MTPQQDDRQPSVDPEGNVIAASGTKSALKKRRRESDESGEDGEEEAEPIERRKRVKKQRKVKWDQVCLVSYLVTIRPSADQLEPGDVR
jgi:hypothetical protein